VIDSKSVAIRPEQAYTDNIVIQIAEFNKRPDINIRGTVKNCGALAFQNRAV
jgi:hypothetical protein